MSIPVKICKSANKLFRLPVHPFNLNNNGVMTYSQWLFEKGMDTIRLYLDMTTTDEMFRDKTVLDVGCGAGGKTLYYATLGVIKIYGLDILEKYKKEADELAREKQLSDKFEFVCMDASKTSFPGDFFDTIIMNDTMEHVDHPLDVLNECLRILKPGGRVYLNFPPYNHPFGAHLKDAIGIPWVHCFFSDRTLIEVYKDLVGKLPDGPERIRFRISRDKDGKEYFSYINRISIRRYRNILKQTAFKVNYYKEVPLEKKLSFLTRMPVSKEFFTKFVVCILEK